MARRSARKPQRYFAPDSKAGAQMVGSLSESLAQLREDLRDKALRSAVHAGAKLLFDELRVRVPVDQGTLYGAIYEWRDIKQSTDARQVYAVGVNKRKAPHWFNVEYGHWRVNVVVRGPGGQFMATRERLQAPVWVAAHPYLRPAWDTRSADALQAMRKRLGERVAELARGEA